MTTPEVAEDPVLVRLPGTLLEDGLLDGMPSAWQVPQLRGPVLNDIVSVVSEIVGVSSGLVTIGVAHDQIGALARKVVGIFRRRHEATSQPSTFAIEVKPPQGPPVVIWVGNDEAASRELAKVLVRLNGGQPGSAVQADDASQPGLTVPSRQQRSRRRQAALAEARRYLVAADPDSLAAGIAAARSALAKLPLGDAARGACLAGLSLALGKDYERTGDVAVLDEAVAVGRQALAAASQSNSTDRAWLLSVAAQVLLLHCARADDPSALSEATGAARQALRETPLESPERAYALTVLGSALVARFQATGDADALAEATRMLRAAVEATPDASPERAERLNRLGSCLMREFSQTGNGETLAAAERLLRQAVDAAPDGHHERPLAKSNLGLALLTGLDITGHDVARDVARLDEATAAVREAIAVTGESDVSLPIHLDNLGTALALRYRHLSADPADMDAAIRARRRALALTPDGAPGRRGRLGALSRALVFRGTASADAGMLEEALTLARQAVDGVPAGSGHLAALLEDLGTALAGLASHTGHLAYLDEAIEVYLRVVAAAPASHPRLPFWLMSLVGACLARSAAEADDSPGPAGRIIGFARQVAASLPAGHPAYPRLLLMLGMAHTYGRNPASPDVAQLDQAITLFRQTAEAIPDGNVLHAAALGQLSGALHSRFQVTADPADFEEAIRAARGAVAATPEQHPDSSITRGYLALLLDDTDEALSLARSAVASARPGSASWELALSALVATLSSRLSKNAPQEQGPGEAPGDDPGERAGHPQPEDAELRLIEEALAASRTLASSPAASTKVRLSANAMAAAAIYHKDKHLAADAYGAAVELLPQVADPAMWRAEAEGHLAAHSDIVRDAAACALRAGNPDRAVALLEMGRGVLLSRALESRSDLTDLRAHDPALADRFSYLCQVLEEDPAADAGQPQWLMSRVAAGLAEPGEAKLVAEEARKTTDRQRHAAELQALLATIRSLPGHEHFAAVPPVASLIEQASEGPLVLVNASWMGCDVLAVTASGIQAIPLPPTIASSTVEDRAADFLGALSAMQNPRQWPEAQRRIASTLAWLWDNLTEPVLDALGFSAAPPPGKPWPRIWWIPVGPFAMLPLHAAGHHASDRDSGARTVIDRVVSSYTPTIRALGHAREHRARSRVPARRAEGVAVAMRQTPGAADLPGTEREVRLIREQLPGARILLNEQATRGTVLAELPRAAWAHFGCHAVGYPDDPSAGRLLVHDHDANPLTVLDISRLRLANAELAYLSACTTAAPGTKISDEAIHLASAFLLAGYPEVIATLGPVADNVAADIADDVYGLLGAGRSHRLDASAAARALHAATRRQRARHGSTSAQWALHIHVGA